MFRSELGGGNAARQAVLTLLPVVMGAAVLVAGGDGPAPGMWRLEATQSVVPAPAPQLAEAVVPLAGPAGGAGVEAVVAAPSVVGDSAGATAEGPAVVDGMLPAPEPEAGAPGAASDTASAVVASDTASPASASSPGAEGPAPSRPDTTTSTSSSSTTTTTTTTTAPPAPAGRARNAGAEAEVVPLTNADRAAAGLGALSRNACLDAMASGYAEQMARNGVLAHNPGAGAAVTGCRENATWGDNVGWSTACDTARLEKEWMASPSHRRNILTGAFTLIGVGAWTDEAGECWVQVLFST